MIDYSEVGNKFKTQYRLTDCQQHTMEYPVPFHTALLQTVGVEQPEVPLLPATYRRKYKIEPVGNDIGAFLNAELNVNRLNEVHSFLWLVGLPGTPRALHYQVMKKREIIVTEQLDLHLVWSASTSAFIFIKPLPRFLFNSAFWRTQICPRPHLYETALGFLLSYVALVEREVDYNLAILNGLIPREVTWIGWLTLVNEVLCATAQAKQCLKEATITSSVELLEGPACVNKRFLYGELRLGRLNWIYRLTRGDLRGCTHS
jgi:hypothetical protein